MKSKGKTERKRNPSANNSTTSLDWLSKDTEWVALPPQQLGPLGVHLLAEIVRQGPADTAHMFPSATMPAFRLHLLPGAGSTPR